MSGSLLPKEYREFLGLGAEITASILFPLFIGYLFDSFADSKPLGLLIGSLLGFILFTRIIMKIYKKFSSPDK